MDSKGGGSHLCCEAFFRLFPSSPSSPSSISPKSESSPELSPLSLPSLWDSPEVVKINGESRGLEEINLGNGSGNVTDSRKW